jgi:signal transduction histidine kinase
VHQLQPQAESHNQELLASRQRLRELAAHLEAVREEERRSIAAALHDELGQLLTSIRLELSGAVDTYRRTTTSASIDVIDRLQAAAGLVDLAVGFVRRISSDLRPPILDELGLIPAVRWEAALFEKRTGLRCRVTARRHDIALPTEHVTALYRIFREALTNVARHAKAGSVWVKVQASRGFVFLEVRDNGVGISEKDARDPAALGLLGMRERALAAGGDVRITRGRRRGTHVQVILPVATSRPLKQILPPGHGGRFTTRRRGSDR